MLRQINSGGDNLHVPGCLCFSGVFTCQRIVSESVTNLLRSRKCWNSHVVSSIPQVLPTSTTQPLQEALAPGVQIPSQWKGSGTIQSHTGAWESTMGSSWFRKCLFALVPSGCPHCQAVHGCHGSGAIPLSLGAFTPPRPGDVLQYFNAKSIPVRECMLCGALTHLLYIYSTYLTGLTSPKACSTHQI